MKTKNKQELEKLFKNLKLSKQPSASTVKDLDQIRQTPPLQSLVQDFDPLIPPPLSPVQNSTPLRPQAPPLQTPQDLAQPQSQELSMPLSNIVSLDVQKEKFIINPYLINPNLGLIFSDEDEESLIKWSTSQLESAFLPHYKCSSQNSKSNLAKNGLTIYYKCQYCKKTKITFYYLYQIDSNFNENTNSYNPSSMKHKDECSEKCKKLRLWFKYSNECPVCRTNLPAGLKGYQNHVGNLSSKEELDRHNNYIKI